MSEAKPMRGQMSKLDAQDFCDAVMARVPNELFIGAAILRHVTALAAFRAAQRMEIIPPRRPDHAVAVIIDSFRNATTTSQIPQVRSQVAFWAFHKNALALQSAVEAVWPKFFGAKP